jgi:PEP-CTERM motif
MKKGAVQSLVAAAIAVAPALALADTYDWTNWNSFTPGSPGGSASGTMPITGVGVSYSGEVDSGSLLAGAPVPAGYPTWTPTTTFAGGNVDNGPPSTGGVVRLSGGGAVVDTITFSSAVTNPVISIWSLGEPTVNSSFVFGETPIIVSGGPSSEYGGAGLSILGNTVSGTEGNGTIEFLGTFKSLSWTNPGFEDWYGFTVGAPVPEPSTYALMLSGLGLLAWMGRRKLLRSPVGAAGMA